MNNLVAAQPQRAAALNAALKKQLRSEQDRASKSNVVPVELLEQLGALGYVGPGVSQRSRASGADPKDKIGEHKVVNRLMREGLMRLREQDFAGSLQRLRALRKRGVDSFEVNYYTGRALTGLKRHREASPYYERAGERLPAFVPAYLALAEARQAAGDLKGAVAALRKGQSASPNDRRLYEREAAIRRQQGAFADAARAYTHVLSRAPQDALAHVQLGELHQAQGDSKRAIELFRRAVKLDPAPASYWNTLGMALGATGDSVRGFRRIS